MPTYFAYGSNMSTARLRARIPEAHPHGAGRIVGWRLVLDKPSRDGSAKANITRAPDAVVWGVLWSIPDAAWPTLDRYEPGYDRVDCTLVDIRGERRTATTYVYRGRRTVADPYAWYLQHMVEGAREHALPDAWRRHLAALRSGVRGLAALRAGAAPPGVSGGAGRLAAGGWRPSGGGRVVGRRRSI